MERRHFMRRLLGAGAAMPVLSVTLAGDSPVASPIIEPAGLVNEQAWPSRQAPERYRGYLLFWTGWKASHTDAYFCGQWLGWPAVRVGMLRTDPRWSAFKERWPNLYVNAPGFSGGSYREGDTFAIYHDPPVEFITSLSERVALIVEGRSWMRRLVDRVPDVPSHDDLRLWGRQRG